jgi:hypothetical protein
VVRVCVCGCVCEAGSGGEGEVLRSVERKHFLGVVILGEDADHSL